MVPLLHEVAANWRDQRSKGKVTKSLKQTLLQYVAAEIITRVTTFAGDKSAQTKAQEMGWVTSDMEYNYLDWNAEEQKLVPRQEGTLTQDQVLADARRLKALLKQPELILKFSAARNAQPDSTSETATFVLELSGLRPVAPPQTGPPGAVAADQGDSGSSRLVNGPAPTFLCAPALSRPLAVLVLHNPGNHCYLDSVVYMLAYACTLSAPTGPLRGATALEHALHSTVHEMGLGTSPSEHTLADTSVWRSLLREWPQVHHQQDCMELLHHLLERNPISFTTSRWEARPIPGTAAARRPLVCGTTYLDIPLPRRAHATIQECVLQWHEQKTPHGLVVAPPILLVSLARYASLTRGKNPIRLPCKAMQKVSFPVFQGSGHDVVWTSYVLVAGIMHLGPRPQSGHYRSFLAHPAGLVDALPQAPATCTAELSTGPAGDRGLSAPSGTPSAPSGSRQYTWWCTDDGKPAEVCHPTYYRTLSENCYVLCFCHTAYLSTS